MAQDRTVTRIHNLLKDRNIFCILLKLLVINNKKLLGFLSGYLELGKVETLAAKYCYISTDVFSLSIAMIHHCRKSPGIKKKKKQILGKYQDRKIFYKTNCVFTLCFAANYLSVFFFFVSNTIYYLLLRE